MGITAVATGRILELLGYRFDKHVTDSAVAADAECAGGTVTPCMMIGTWSARWPPSDRQPHPPGTRQSLMLSRPHR
jgi:hypothetical protein